MDIGILFKEKVMEIWDDCIAKENNPWQNENNFFGNALNVSFPFNPDKLIKHSVTICKLISLVHNADTYDELRFLDTGEKWSELRQPVSFLMALGNALQIVEFKNPQENWTKRERKNPEITFKL